MCEFDTSIAERNSLGRGFVFHELVGHICRYSFDLKVWYVYDGRSWVQDNSEIMEVLRTTVRARILEDAERLLNAADSEKFNSSYERRQQRAEAEAFREYAQKSLSTPRALAVMVDAAKTVWKDGKAVSLGVRPEDFDTHRHLLNLENCLVDLKRGEALPHDAALMMSNISPSVYYPDAQAPLFLEAVHQIMGGDRPLCQYE